MDFYFIFLLQPNTQVRLIKCGNSARLPINFGFNCITYTGNKNSSLSAKTSIQKQKRKKN